MEKMTVTRGLAELKLLDSRIEKEVATARFIDVFQNRTDKVLNAQTTKDDFDKKTRATYQSIVDLISRRNAIKSAILRSNGTAKVKIGAKEFLVTEAIARKNSIECEKKLLTAMRVQWTRHTGECEKYRVELDNKVETLLKANLGADKKTDQSMYDLVAKPFIDQNEIRLLDPLGLKDKIDSLDSEIDEFLKNVDFSLSESNARNEIEV